MTTSSKSDTDSHCSLLSLYASLGAGSAGSYFGFAKVTILDT